MGIGRGGTLKHSLIVDEHGFLLLDLGDELQCGRLVPQLFTILTGLLLGLVVLRRELFADLHLLHFESLE